MANKLYKEEHIQAIAAAIRSKVGGTAKYTVAQMAAAIDSIKTGAVLQTKTATPTESEQTITPDSGFDGLSAVPVQAIPNNYVGSAITRRGSANLSASGAKVTAPAGYYETAAEKSVAAGSVTVNKPTVDSAGLVTAGVTVSAGYVSGNPANNTLQLSTQAGKTITPTKAQQQAVAASRFTTGAILVDPIPDEYIIPTGSKDISANGNNIDVSAVATVNVNVPTGGGLPTGFSVIATGTHTLNSAVAGGSTFTVSHNLGVVPDMFIFYATSNVATTYSMLMAMRSPQFGWRSTSYLNKCFYHGNSTTTVTGADVTTSYGIKTLTATQATVTTYSNSGSYYWRAGTYKWIAIKFS